jgi:orotate phosphoribosyltransferase
MEDEVGRLLRARTGHFCLESGHHGELWLELPFLFLQPDRVIPLAQELGRRIRRLDVEVVCGPLVEGAFVGLTVAAELGVPFTYAERVAPAPSSSRLFPYEYRLPAALRGEVRGKRVAIVNDVVNAGSAVRGTCRDLCACGARPVVIATLLVLGEAAAALAAGDGVALETLAARPNRVWAPEACPLCAAGVAVDEVGE